jgi:hypothetical protein
VQACSTYLWQVRYGGDDGPCEAREKQYCLDAFAAPSTGKTAQGTEDCVAALAGVACADFLANKIPAACVPHPGGLGNAASCAFDSQCTSGFCAISQGFACGKCAPPTKAGDSCAATGLCATETNGQYCTATTQVCTTPVEQSGACDGTNTLCAGGLTCVGLATAPMGTCAPAATTLGADCAPVAQGGAGCDRNHGMQCDGMTKKCAAMTFASTGEACGTINGYVVPCASEGVCNISTGQTKGTCVAAAADGAACDTAVGPGCAYRSQCVVSSGTAGTCQPPIGAACH